MIKVISLANRVARAPAIRRVIGEKGSAHGIRTALRPQACRQRQQQWVLRSLTRELSSRGGGRASRQDRWQRRQQQRVPKSNQGTAAACGAAVLAGVVIWQVNQDEAPYTHRKRFMIISRDGEFLKGISKSNWASVKQQYGPKVLPRTHQATRTVERIGKRIAEASELKGCAWEFIVVRDDNMNAFVLPGGKVVVFTGLLNVTPNEDALASVLGHEVGHVVANHAGEKLSKNFLTEGLLLLLFAVTGFEYFDVARSIGSLVFDLPNSREMELEADFIGLQLMSKACFDPHEMPETFGRMEARTKKMGISKGPAYMSTHPADAERIAKQREWMVSAIQTRQRSGCRELQELRAMF
ncbi:unnamed protein product [Ectocarpus sp. CCAP 1310/34]|nr:unnamed protein product [Ectocarpus sp. CCAP 1310/34]